MRNFSKGILAFICLTSFSPILNAQVKLVDSKGALRDTAVILAGRVKYTDTVNMLLPYLRKVDTIRASPFFKSGGTDDAGNNKILPIYRNEGILTNIGGATLTSPYANVGFHTISNANNLSSIIVETVGGSASQQAGMNFITKSNSTQLGASGNKGWQVAARADAWNSSGTQEANLLNFSYWTGSAWTQVAKFTAGGNVAIGSMALNTLPLNKLDVVGSAAIGSYAGVNTAPTNGLIVSGNVGIGTSSPTTILDVQSAGTVNYTSVGKFLAPGNTGAGNATQMNFGTVMSAGNNAEWRFIYQGNNSATNRVDFGMNGYNSPTISYLVNGRVGIGNGSPSTKLDVVGTGKFSDTLYGTRAQFNSLPSGAVTDSVVTLDASGNLKKRTLNSITSEPWFKESTSVGSTSNTDNIYTMGNVAIGINSPTATLHVNNSLASSNTINADAVLLKFSRPSISNVKWGNTAQFKLGSYSLVTPNISESKTRLDLQLTDNNDNTTFSDVMTWQANGNVGIRNTAPANRLEITHGTAGNSGLRFTNLTSNSAPNLATNFLSLDAFGNVIYSTPGTLLPLITANGFYTSTTEVRDFNVWARRGNGFYITDVNGDITSPIPNASAWLQLSQVVKNSKYYAQTVLNDKGFWFRGGDTVSIPENNWNRMLFLNASSRFNINWDNATNNTININNVDNGPMTFATNNIERMRILAGGNIGIGTSSPSNPLHILNSAPTSLYIESTTADNNGMLILNANTASSWSNNWHEFISFKNQNTTIGSVTNNGTSAVSFLTTSDERLKENIQPTSFSIADLQKIQIKDFNYKTDKGTNPQTGVIAQQLYKVIPRVVTVGGADAAQNPWQVDYGKLTPYLIKAVQDQQQQIEQLEKKSNNQTDQIKEMNLQNQRLVDLINQLEKRIQSLEKK
jgi:hypothetical protein